MNVPPTSVVVRSFNEGWALRETLAGIAAQNYNSWELIVIDSGSTDGSVEMIRNARPRHFIQIPSKAYKPGRVMNQAMELASADFVVFLNADATPEGTKWLMPLVGALESPNTGA